MAERTFEKWADRRLARMREGKAVIEVVELLSDPEIRLALVPLTDAEYMNSLEVAASRVEIPDTEHGIVLKDRIQQNGIILAAAREIDNLEERFFSNYDEVATLPSHDINHIWDCYREMVSNSSPSLEGISVEQMEELKKVLQETDLSDLSGPAWYALKRFLSVISVPQHLVKSPGSTSTKSSTMKRREIVST